MAAVAIVGSGPSGLYLAEALSKGDEMLRVDVFDRLPGPFGLLRYGVAPDHVSTRRIVETLARVLDRSNVRFFGGIKVGQDLSSTDMLYHYDAVVLATGAYRGRRVAVDGLPTDCSRTAIDTALWINGHPDFDQYSLPSAVRSVVVVGAGNVALDMARLFAKGGAGLAGISISDAARKWLAAHPIEEIHLLIRGNAQNTRFSPAELKELLQLNGFCATVATDDVDGPIAGEGANLAAYKLIRQLEPSCNPGSRSLTFHFNSAPRRWSAGNLQVETRHGIRHVACDLMIHAIGQETATQDGLHSLAVRASKSGRDQILDRPGLSYAIGWCAEPGVGAIPAQRIAAQALSVRMRTDLAKLAAENRPDIATYFHARGIQPVAWQPRGFAPREPQISEAAIFAAGA